MTMKMMNKEITLYYQEFENEDELSEVDRDLLNLAKESSKFAHSPYSHFKVGAAVLLNNGEVSLGNNQENSSYSATICAERVALHSAFSMSGVPVKSIAIYGSEGITTGPCGVCRQVMGDYEMKSGQKMRIIIKCGLDRILVFDGVENLLPFQFFL